MRSTINPNAASIATRAVLDGSQPIAYVYLDGGMFQFLPEGNEGVEDAAMVSVGEILQLDPSVEAILAQLSDTVMAYRPAPSEPWYLQEVDGD